MFLRKNASSEIEAAFQEELIKNAVEETTSELTKVAEALDLVSNAAEIFDSVGMHKEAEYMTIVLESLAAKKKKKAPKAKKKDEDKEEKTSKSKKKSDEATKDLTSEKMEDNLKHKGWVFNADDNDADDDNYSIFDPKNKWKYRVPSKSNQESDPSFWRSKAKHWYQKSLDAQTAGRHADARAAFIRAEDCEDRADQADKAGALHVNDIDDNFTNEKDDEFYAKDERESDLARIMHEIEEGSGPEPEFRAELEDELHDDWDFPLHNTRSPRKF